MPSRVARPLEAAGPLPPLVAREPPLAPSSPQGIGGLIDALQGMVEHEVRDQVASALKPRAATEPRAAKSAQAVDVTSDDFVRRLMERMRSLSQEERFRAGGLR